MASSKKEKERVQTFDRKYANIDDRVVLRRESQVYLIECARFRTYLMRMLYG
jgi:hypothetical protein